MRFEGSNFASVGSGTVVVVRENGNRTALDPRRDLHNHSPDGFQAGYGGSGPAQLALAIMAELYDDETATMYYQRFKEDVIAELDSDKWVLEESAVRDWKRRIEAVR